MMIKSVLESLMQAFKHYFSSRVESLTKNVVRNTSDFACDDALANVSCIPFISGRQRCSNDLRIGEKMFLP